MKLTEEFEKHLNETLETRTAEQEVRPRVEVWPVEDEFGRWVAEHEDKARAVVCDTPELKDTPFCGSGYH